MSLLRPAYYFEIFTVFWGTSCTIEWDIRTRLIITNEKTISKVEIIGYRALFFIWSDYFLLKRETDGVSVWLFCLKHFYQSFNWYLTYELAKMILSWDWSMKVYIQSYEGWMYSLCYQLSIRLGHQFYSILYFGSFIFISWTRIMKWNSRKFSYYYAESTLLVNKFLPTCFLYLDTYLPTQHFFRF